MKLWHGSVATQRKPLATLRQKSSGQRRFVLRVVYVEQHGAVDLSHRVCDCIMYAANLIRVPLEPIVRACVFGRRTDAVVERARAGRTRYVEIRKIHIHVNRLAAGVSGGNRAETGGKSAEDRGSNKAT